MTRLKLLIIGASLLTTVAHAEDTTFYVMPQIPDEATKVWALKRAYQLNGNSMVSNGRMIDVSRELFPVPPVKNEDAASASAPAPAPVARKKVAMVAAPVSDLCTRHHRHKVYTDNGKSWRCR